MIGDFDDSANAMWSLHLDEAKSHDEARIYALKDDMDSVLIFVRDYSSSFSSPSSCPVFQAGLFSATLTSFLVDSASNLQVDPAQQMVFYQQQNVELLAQISKQISSIALQASIPSTPLPSFDFSPRTSDVRVNVYWFMSLIFSISAALLATLVQHWVQEYMQVFQRYSNPLKSARLRQYLYEGVERWYMPTVARSVPGLVHISLFLFFLGLGELLLATYTLVGITTIIPIAICSLLYILSMFAPIIHPQSPFRNPFSGLIWYLKQKVHPRRYLDRASGGSLKAVSSNLYEGRMQLSMEEGDGRGDRDARAIQWLIHNRTEDDEVESFVVAIPGAFTSKWGIDVWRKVSGVKQYEDTDFRPNDPTVRSQSDEGLPMSAPPHHHSQPPQCTRHLFGLLRPLERINGTQVENGTFRDMTVTRSIPRLPSDIQARENPHAHGDLAIYDLCKRVQHLVHTCDNYGIFTNEESWFKRARGCIETAASLVFCANIKLEQFGDLGKLLPPLSKFIAVDAPNLTTPVRDGLFVARWTCLSFVTLTRGMENHERIRQHARSAIDNLSRFRMEGDSEQTNNGRDDDENALRNAQSIDLDFDFAGRFCIYELRKSISPSEVEMTEEQARRVLAWRHQADISRLEHIALAADHVAMVDKAIFDMQHFISAFAHGLILSLRGAHFDALEQEELIQPIQFFNPHPITERPTFLPQFLFLHQRLRFLCSYSSKLRDIIDQRGTGTYEEILEGLKTLWGESDNPATHNWSDNRRGRLMERQLWRLQDLRDGGGFGFWVELFFLMAHQLLLFPLSPDAQSTLIVGTFRNVTSNWRQHKHSIGTQRVILSLVCDIAIFSNGILSGLGFPRYITDELLVLLENMVEGQSGSHIDEAMKELEAANETDAMMEQKKEQDSGRIPWWTPVTDDVSLFRTEVIKVILRSRAPVLSS